MAAAKPDIFGSGQKRWQLEGLAIDEVDAIDHQPGQPVRSRLRGDQHAVGRIAGEAHQRRWPEFVASASRTHDGGGPRWVSGRYHARNRVRALAEHQALVVIEYEPWRDQFLRALLLDPAHVGHPADVSGGVDLHHRRFDDIEPARIDLDDANRAALLAVDDEWQRD